MKNTVCVGANQECGFDPSDWFVYPERVIEDTKHRVKCLCCGKFLAVNSDGTLHFHKERRQPG